MTEVWERLAESAEGDVAGLAMAAVDGGSLIFAATVVGVYRSADGGRSWTLPGASRSSVPFAEAVALSPRFAQDRTIFTCAGETLYRSADAGEDWQQVLVGSRMLCVAMAFEKGPENSHTVALVGTETDGILRSDDVGRTWTGANAGLLDLTVIALALSPAFASDRIGFAGTAAGLYRTRNGAASWREVETGLDDPAVQCLAISPTFAEDRLVLAGTEADGLLRSDDAGTTWHQPPALAGRGVTALAFSSEYASRQTIVAATDLGIAVSQDGGQTWHTAAGSAAEVLSLICVADAEGETLLAGLHRHRLVRSADGGATWIPSNDGLSANQLVDLALSPAFAHDQTLFSAGIQDGVRVSLDGGRTWSACTGWSDNSAAVGLALSPAFADDHTVYAATASGLRISRDAGMTWQEPTHTSAAARGVVTAAAGAGVSAMVLTAASGGVLLASDDASATWRTLTASWGAVEITSLAFSPEFARDKTIFVATTSRPGTVEPPEVVLWRSTDGGERWHRWFVAPLRSDTLAAVALAPSYAVDEVVFVGLGGRIFKPIARTREVRAHERRPIWRPVDVGGGATAVTALAVSPGYAEDHTLFAATNVGVFVSRDGGESYRPWNDGLTPSRAIALAISPDYGNDRLIYALGAGGALWRRRDTP